MAIACLRLFTLPAFPCLPERSVPRFCRRTALPTVLREALLYLGILPPFRSFQIGASFLDLSDQIKTSTRPVPA
ncbi:MAG TPA: hypothetical protein VE242_14040 [Chthoniobacterales bacterium]|nr:hypothetical protein [Chthoniobacterales bacterium]